MASAGLQGKTAVVTGSSTGIGFAVAKALAQSGARVFLNGRDAGWLDAAVKLLRREVTGAFVDGVAADLGTAAGCALVIEQCPDADVLVNNLGVFAPKAFLDITDDEWQRFFDVNVLSGVRLSRHYVRGMAVRGFGRVLFNASVTSGFVDGEMVHYGATKAAVLGLSRGLAESVAGTGVTVNAFVPGPTRTERVDTHLRSTEGALVEQRVVAESLIRRFVEPDEVAALVAFLASPQAGAITGAALRVDGGIVRTLV